MRSDPSRRLRRRSKVGEGVGCAEHVVRELGIGHVLVEDGGVVTASAASLEVWTAPLMILRCHGVGGELRVWTDPSKSSRRPRSWREA